MAILACKNCGLNIKDIFKRIKKIKSVDGRLELVRNLPNRSKVFLDYAKINVFAVTDALAKLTPSTVPNACITSSK